MKILVTGAQGMLGTELVPILEKNHEVYGMDRLRDTRTHFFVSDITNRNDVILAIERVRPKIVIHAAAMTDVDGCEKDRLKASKVNFDGTKNVVDGCRHVKGMLIYISTDFVFSGTQDMPYRESSIPNPISVYGETKLLGEFYVRAQSPEYLILRTSWLFGKHGNNFMSKIIQKASESKELHVVNDQKGSPTYAVDLSRAIEKVIQTIGAGEKSNALNAIYHITNQGEATRYDIACTLLKMANMDVQVHPIESDELKSAAKRPRNSALDCSRLEKIYGIKLRSWQEALRDYLQEMKADMYEKK